MSKIRIGIVGYGNIGRGVELAVERNEDMELVAVVTRRDPKSVQILTEGVKKVHFDDILTLKDEVDVMILCGGSATDLPVMGPEIAKHFNMIDSFDTHAKIPEYFADVDTAANEGKKSRNHLCGLGSGNVLPEPYLCRINPRTRKHLYLLGKGSQPGTL